MGHLPAATRPQSTDSAAALSEPPADHLGPPNEPAEDELLREAVRRARLDVAFHGNVSVAFGDPVRAAYPSARDGAAEVALLRRRRGA